MPPQVAVVGRTPVPEVVEPVLAGAALADTVAVTEPVDVAPGLAPVVVTPGGPVPPGVLGRPRPRQEETPSPGHTPAPDVVADEVGGVAVTRRPLQAPDVPDVTRPILFAGAGPSSTPARPFPLQETVPLAGRVGAASGLATPAFGRPPVAVGLARPRPARP